MFLSDHNDGIPGAYPLALNGCGSGLPGEYCEGAVGSSGALGATTEVESTLRLVAAAGIGAIVMGKYGGAVLGKNKTRRMTVGAVAGLALGYLWWK